MRKVQNRMKKAVRRTNRGRRCRRNVVLRHKRRRRVLAKRRRALRLAAWGCNPVNLDNKPSRMSGNPADRMLLENALSDLKKSETHSPMPPAGGSKERDRRGAKRPNKLRTLFGKLFSRKGV